MCLAPLRMVGVRQAPERSARRRSCSVQRPARHCKREVYAHVPRLDEHTILARSDCIPGSYVTSNSMSAGCNALPRFLVLCTSGCIVLLFAQQGHSRHHLRFSTPALPSTFPPSSML